MRPSFDPKFFHSEAYEDFVLDALRAGRVARTLRHHNDNAWSALTTIDTRWSADEGFCRAYRTVSGIGDAQVHNPAEDRTETHVAESSIRSAIRQHRDHNGFRDVLAAAILEDLAAADARGDRAGARNHATRLIGPATPNRAAPLDEVVRSLTAGDRAEARTLADRLLAGMERPGPEVFGLLVGELDDPLNEVQRTALLRTEGWLSALAMLYPLRGAFLYWQSAALELLGRREDALVAYTHARTLGKLTDYHSAQRPADLDPPAGRRALRALQKARLATR